jgi:hypothetical protein
MVIKEPEAKGFKKSEFLAAMKRLSRFGKAAAVSLWTVLQF